MQQPWWVRGYRMFFAALTIAAVVWQFWLNHDNDGFSVVNYFSFFTIQSNIIGAGVFLVGAFRPARRATLGWDLVRGATAMYLTTTFFVYGVLLSGLEETLQTPEPWVNAVLHQIFPVVVAADLLLLPLAHRISFRQSLVWTIYPAAYLVYSLVRGPAVDWYPYPFLDPDETGGYGGVAAYSVAILIGFLLFSALIVWVSGHLRLRIDEDSAGPAPLPAGDA